MVLAETEVIELIPPFPQRIIRVEWRNVSFLYGDHQKQCTCSLAAMQRRLLSIDRAYYAPRPMACL